MLNRFIHVFIAFTFLTTPLFGSTSKPALKDSTVSESMGSTMGHGHKKRPATIRYIDGNISAKDSTAGWLFIKVMDNGHLTDATVNIRPHEKRNSVCSDRSYETVFKNPMRVALLPGRYDIDIKSLKMKGHSSARTISGIEIISGERNEMECHFSSAKLTIGATHNGEVFDSDITIKAADKKYPVAGGRTYKHHETNPRPFWLSPGTYIVEVNPMRLKTLEKHIFTVTLKAGEVKNESADW